MGIRKGLQCNVLRKYGHPDNGGGRRRSAVGGGRRSVVTQVLALEADLGAVPDCKASTTGGNQFQRCN